MPPAGAILLGMDASVGGYVLGLATGTPLHVPELHWFEDDGLSYAVDAAAPNWIVVEPAGRHLLETIASHDGSITFGALVARYAGERQVQAGETRVAIPHLPGAPARAGLPSGQPLPPQPPPRPPALVAPPGPPGRPPPNNKP